jgi:hypothetical protein
MKNYMHQARKLILRIGFIIQEMNAQADTNEFYTFTRTQLL